jgi:hypothetical protein
MTSTKSAPFSKSYAQNLFRAVQKSMAGLVPRHPAHGLRKSLIHKETLNCLFTRQSKESLDLQGFAGFSTKLSTKLSTGNLDNFGAVENQGLSRLSEGLSSAADALGPMR